MRQLAAAGASDEGCPQDDGLRRLDRSSRRLLGRGPAVTLAAAASTLLGVALLGYTGQLVEIEAIAVLP